MSKPRVLVVAPRAPDFDRGSGSQRVFDFVDFLQEAGWSVTFAAGGWCLKSVPRNVRLDERYAGVLQQRGIPTYAGLNTRSRTMIAEGNFDLAVLAYFHVAETWMPAIRSLSPSTRIIVDNLDLNFVRTARQRFQQREHPGEIGLLDGEYATEMIRELNVYAAADLVLAVSQKEADLVNDLTAEPELACVAPDGDDLQTSTIPFAERKGILFLGTFLHPPNLDAATYLCTTIVPQLDPQITVEHPVYLVGDGLDRVARGFDDRSSHVRAVGWVPSVLPYIERARVAVMPLLYGAGTKRKMIHALMVGTPSVATSMAAEGLNLRHDEHFLLANDPALFAHSITQLVRDEELWHRLARSGRDHITATRGREAARQQFLEAVDIAVSRNVKSGDLAKHLEHNRPPVNDPRSLLIRRVRRAVQTGLKMSGIVLVVSAGDDEFLNLDGRSTWHFPRGPGGRWAGKNPANGDEAVEHLEELRVRGGRFLLFPSSSFWWLEHYPEFKRHLDERYSVALKNWDCIIYSLIEQDAKREPPLINGTGLEAHTAGGAAGPQDSTELDQTLTSALQTRMAGPMPAPIVVAREYIDQLRNRSASPRVLVVGSYHGDRQNSMDCIVPLLSSSVYALPTQRWIAVGSNHPDAEVQNVTVQVVPDSLGSYDAANAVLSREHVEDFDYVVVMDGSNVLPEGFLDSFIAVQQHLDFALAQPALTAGSDADLPMMVQQLGVLARQTMIVRPQQPVSFHRSIYTLVFPFDNASPDGFGFDRVWAYELDRRNFKMGIVDAVPVRIGQRDQISSELQQSAFLRQRDHLSLENCMRVLDVVGLKEMEVAAR